MMSKKILWNSPKRKWKLTCLCGRKFEEHEWDDLELLLEKHLKKCWVMKERIAYIKNKQEIVKRLKEMFEARKKFLSESGFKLPKNIKDE